MHLDHFLKQHTLTQILINSVLGIFPGTYFSFRHASPDHPVLLFALDAEPLHPSLFGDCLVTALLMPLLLTWITFFFIRKQFAKGELSLAESQRLTKGKQWKTSGFKTGLLFAAVAVALTLLVGALAKLFVGALVITSLLSVLGFKLLLSMVLSGTVAYWGARRLVLNLDALQRPS